TAPPIRGLRLHTARTGWFAWRFLPLGSRVSLLRQITDLTEDRKARPASDERHDDGEVMTRGLDFCVLRQHHTRVRGPPEPARSTRDRDISADPCCGFRPSSRRAA